MTSKVTLEYPNGLKITIEPAKIEGIYFGDVPPCGPLPHDYFRYKPDTKTECNLSDLRIDGWNLGEYYR